MSRTSGAIAVALALGAAAPAAAVTPPQPTRGTARLQGRFSLAGRVTVANNVLGERAGHRVTRIWTFTPRCATGACTTIALARGRAAGSDQLVLRLRAPGYYVGTGSFLAPLRCGRRTWPAGSAVPFTITVRVTAAALAGSDVVATQIRAAYTNRSRSNRTPCVAVLGHDAAVYTGQVVPAAPPGAGAGPADARPAGGGPAGARPADAGP